MFSSNRAKSEIKIRLIGKPVPFLATKIRWGPPEIVIKVLICGLAQVLRSRSAGNRCCAARNGSLSLLKADISGFSLYSFDIRLCDTFWRCFRAILAWQARIPAERERRTCVNPMITGLITISGWPHLIFTTKKGTGFLMSSISISDFASIRRKLSLFQRPFKFLKLGIEKRY